MHAMVSDDYEEAEVQLKDVKWQAGKVKSKVVEFFTDDLVLNDEDDSRMGVVDTDSYSNSDSYCNSAI
jgi:hypothetical protein